MGWGSFLEVFSTFLGLMKQQRLTIWIKEGQGNNGNLIDVLPYLTHHFCGKYYVFNRLYTQPSPTSTKISQKITWVTNKPTALHLTLPQRQKQSLLHHIKHLSQKSLLIVNNHTMNILEKIGAAIEQRNQMFFDNFGRGIEAMASSFDTFDIDTIGKRINKKMMVHFDAIGNYFMEGSNQDELLEKLGDKIVQKQETAFEPILEYFNKPAYELDQNLFGKVVKFQEDKNQGKVNVQVVPMPILFRSQSEKSVVSRKTLVVKRLPSNQGSVERPRNPSSDGSISSSRSYKKVSPANKQSKGISRSIEKPKRNPSSQGSVRIIEKPRKLLSSKGSIKSIERPRKPQSIHGSRGKSRSIERPRRPPSSQKSKHSSQRSIKRASPANKQSPRSIRRCLTPGSEGKSSSVYSEQRSQLSVQEKKELRKQQSLIEIQLIPSDSFNDDNNLLPQQCRPWSPKIGIQIVPNTDINVQIEKEYQTAKDNADILIERAQRLENRYHRAEDLKAQITKLYPLTQKTEEKPQEDEDNNENGHSTVKIELQQPGQANTEKNEVSPTDNAETVKPSRLQKSVERPSSIKKQKTPPKMPYNIDIQGSRSIEKAKSLTPKKL